MNPPEVYGALTLAIDAYNKSLSPIGRNLYRRRNYRQKQLQKYQKHLARATRYLTTRS